MLYKQFLSLLFILPPLLFSSCDENIKITLDTDKEPELPPITMEGKQTFGCLLNGEVWRHTPRAFARNLSGDYSPFWKTFNLRGKRTNPKDQGDIESSIRFSATIDTLGIYDFNYISYYDQSFPEFGFITEESLIENETHFLEIIHLDLENFIISGLFQFSLLDTLTGDTLRFTEGRFDYKWAY